MAGPSTDPMPVAVVTGGGSGIGRASALRLSVEGFRVVAADRNLESAEATAGLLETRGGRGSALPVDVADPASVSGLMAAVQSQWGRVDVLVNSAGITDRVDVLDFDAAAFDRVMKVNAYGTLYCCQAAARLMAAGGRGGRIVNISSVSGQTGGKGRIAYGASKAAVISMTQTLAVELAEHGILVNSVAPAPTDVPRLAHDDRQRAAFLARMPLGRYAQPEEVAAAVAFLVSPGASFITGHTLNVDGGFMSTGVWYRP